MTVLKYAGTDYKLAEGWDATKVADVIREARQEAINAGHDASVALATIDLRNGAKVAILVEPGIPLAVEIPNPHLTERRSVIVS